MESIAGPVVGTLFAPIMSKIFRDKSTANVGSVAAPPTVTPPTPMPDPLAQKAKARRKAAMFDATRMGAADTVLTGENTKLG